MSSEPRPGQARRQEVIDILCEAYARDEVEIEEFERRVETAHRAQTAAELDTLLSDLAAPSRVPASRPFSPKAADPQAETRALAGARVRAYFGVDSERDRDTVVGIMGGAARRGRWTPARKITAVGIMGGVELDFREAVFGPGVTEVQAFAFWGGIEIIAPPNVRVECSGIGIMGGFDHRQEIEEAPAEGAPILRVTGLAIMGGVDVKVRYPGESGRDARRRLKDQRRDRRLGPGRGEG